MSSQQPCEGSAASEQMTPKSPLCSGSPLKSWTVLWRFSVSASLTLGLWLSSGDPEWRKSGIAAGLGEEKGTTEDEMAGWHHWLDGRGFGWTPGVGDGQGGLACCNSWGRKESDTTERLNWTELNIDSMFIESINIFIDSINNIIGLIQYKYSWSIHNSVLTDCRKCSWYWHRGKEL